MGYVGHLGAEAAAQPVTLESIAAQNAEIIRWQKDDAQSRKIALVLGVLGALFAAVKLGVIAIPHLRRKRAGQIGELATIGSVANPRRRRRK